jgi:ankyrin repeat protein
VNTPVSTNHFLLQLSRLLNEADKKGDLPLLLALKTKQKTVASSLVEHGACVDARDPEGLTLLLSAVEKGIFYTCLILISGSEIYLNKYQTVPDSLIFLSFFYSTLTFIKISFVRIRACHFSISMQ